MTTTTAPTSAELQEKIDERRRRLAEVEGDQATAAAQLEQAKQNYLAGGGSSVMVECQARASALESAHAMLAEEIEQLESDHAAALEAERCDVVFDELAEVAAAGNASLAELVAAWTEGLRQLQSILERIENARRAHIKNRLQFINVGEQVAPVAQIANALEAARPDADVSGICNAHFGLQRPFDRSDGQGMPAYVHMPYRVNLAEIAANYARKRHAEEEAEKEAQDAAWLKQQAEKKAAHEAAPELVRGVVASSPDYFPNSLVTGRIETVR